MFPSVFSDARRRAGTQVLVLECGRGQVTFSGLGVGFIQGVQVSDQGVEAAVGVLGDVGGVPVDQAVGQEEGLDAEGGGGEVFGGVVSYHQAFFGMYVGMG